jgi:FtsP/CotA-like multicopper oxidase with cupredoxin domain
MRLRFAPKADITQRLIGHEAMMGQLSRRTMLLAGSAWAFTGFGPSNVRAQTASERPSLPIPPELRADAAGMIKLDARTGTMRFLGDRDTATYGINGPYLGPALRLRRGETATVQVTNNVPENITRHGLIIPGSVDGGPHQAIRPGKSWQTELAIDQPAATLGFWSGLFGHASTYRLIPAPMARNLLSSANDGSDISYHAATFSTSGSTQLPSKAPVVLY